MQCLAVRCELVHSVLLLVRRSLEGSDGCSQVLLSLNHENKNLSPTWIRVLPECIGPANTNTQNTDAIISTVCLLMS